MYTRPTAARDARVSVTPARACRNSAASSAQPSTATALFIGARFLLQPRPAAGYGVPAEPNGDAGAYLTIKGLRDGTFGLLGLALLFFVGARAEAWYRLVVAIVPLVDTLIVLRHGGTAARRHQGRGLRNSLRHRGRCAHQCRTALRGLTAPPNERERAQGKPCRCSCRSSTTP
ncbi:hypothetical protein GCM10010251_36130 [Streptomyces aurantiogriseus]|uniref:Uncharacterized protein n=1 Tax=Streptomyces aurantiogriseus TaxID=66870 RepID=A0A918CC94_9ACTN|nr:hypothetical protein GCM10010251_36130 [Streptomyces aurantiogriseus]